jgi:hypothetical protein
MDGIMEHVLAEGHGMGDYTITMGSATLVYTYTIL